MRRLQCKNCRKWDDRDFGKVISQEITIGHLPGFGDRKIPIRISTVECTKCGHTWTYRKKRQ